MQPGVSFFTKNPGKVCSNLRPLIDFAKTALKGRTAALKDIPIYLKATAGMREIPQTYRDAIMLNIRMCLSDEAISPFRFEWRFASVIAGDEEGSFGWLHVNAMLGNLFSPIPDTVGIIDMGGASVQVVFVPTHDVLDNYYPVSHGAGRRLGLYSKSYESFGHKRASERIHEYVIRRYDRQHRVKDDRANHVPHPCYPAGHTFEFGHRRLVGEPDFESCLSSANALFMSNASCYIPDCTFNGIYQPRLLDTPFVGMSGLANVAKQLHFTKDVGTVTMRKWKESSRHVCHASRLENPELCLQSVYIYAFLTTGLGFKEMSQQISFRSEIDGTSPTVSYGFMLHEIQYMAWTNPPTYEYGFYAVTLIAVLMSLAAIYSRLFERGLH